MTVFVVFLPIFVMLLILMIFRSRSVQSTALPNPNANEPDVFATPEADLDAESDTGEPKGRN